VNVRKIEASDVSDMLDLIQAKAKFDGCPESLKLTEDDIVKIFFSDTPKAKAIVAIIDDKIVGIATYYDIFSTFTAQPGMWLDDLYVYEDYRKYGIGKAILVELSVIAKKTVCTRIDWIVANDNTNGKGFYNAMGATIFEDIRHARLDESAIEKLAVMHN
jgi:GNAT superfamily N-acetyltransferase